jgi:hypothetical protein
MASGVGAKFRRQVPIGPTIADFVCIDARLIVELDGATHERFGRQIYDAGLDEWLHAQGWRILRFPNDIVIDGTEFVVARIREAVAADGSHPSRFAGHLVTARDPVLSRPRIRHLSRMVDTEPASNAPALTVSEFSGALKRMIEDRFGYVRVRGEISNYRGPHFSGHVYFCLKDQSAQVNAPHRPMRATFIKRRVSFESWLPSSRLLGCTLAI